MRKYLLDYIGLLRETRGVVTFTRNGWAYFWPRGRVARKMVKHHLKGKSRTVRRFLVRGYAVPVDSRWDALDAISHDPTNPQFLTHWVEDGPLSGFRIIDT